jgi:large subunit ribosomal protein L21
MYAVVETGGKQYRVTVGASLKVEKLSQAIGDVVQLERVLLLENDGEVQTGSPTIDGAAVKAEVLGHGRNKKVQIFKMKRRKKYRRSQGHRQAFTELRVTDIVG